MSNNRSAVGRVDQDVSTCCSSSRGRLRDRAPRALRSRLEMRWAGDRDVVAEDGSASVQEIARKPCESALEIGTAAVIERARERARAVTSSRSTSGSLPTKRTSSPARVRQCRTRRRHGAADGARDLDEMC